jgi:hypothetical protein
MLLWMDGQAHYDTARIGHKYSTVGTGPNTTWSVAPEGRFGNALKRVGGDTSASLTIAPLTTRLAPWVPTTGGVCGFALKIDDLTRLTADDLHNCILLRVMEGNDWHLRLNLNPSGTFTLIGNIGSSEGSGGPNILAHSVEGLSSGSWMYVECKWVIAEAGLFEVRVNGIPILVYSGDTREGDGFWNSLGVWTSVRLFELGSSYLTLTMRMCDLYLADLAASDADDVSDFLGDGIIETILPNGAGSVTGWTPSAGANWAAVDEVTPDDDSSYVAAAAAGTLDRYAFEDIPSTAIVKGIHVCLLARKEEAGTSTLAPVVRTGGTDTVGPTQGITDIAYSRYLTQAWDLNPVTGAKFTAAEINAAEFGVTKVT